MMQVKQRITFLHVVGNLFLVNLALLRSDQRCIHSFQIQDLPLQLSGVSRSRTTGSTFPFTMVHRTRSQFQQQITVLFAAEQQLDSSSGMDASTDTASTTTIPTSIQPPSTKSVFDGKRILPYKIIMNGLKQQNEKIAGVYAIYNSNFIRGSDGWDTTTFVGVTQDVATTIQSLYDNDTTQLNVAHVRILSFTVPSPNAMQEVANQWRMAAMNANAPLQTQWANDVLNYLYDNDIDDEDDDDDDDDFMTDMEMMGTAMAVTGAQQPVASSSSTIISPFAATTVSDSSTNGPNTIPTSSQNSVLEFTADNVDKVLNEVRPYLIADGGNVAVVNVDEQEQIVYVQLQGACGSCASSTITMQMGIERILREKFPSLKEVVQVDTNNDALQSDNDYVQLVQEEINRILPAISAMGGTIQLQSVDVEMGTVQILFRGSKKVQKGIELAILDIDFVKDVQFMES